MRKIDPIILLLAGLLILFTVELFIGEIFFQNDSVFFQVISNLVSMVSGGLLGLIKGRSESKGSETSPPPPPISSEPIT